MGIDAENRRILIIDDNESIHRDFRRILEPDECDSSEIDQLAADLFGTGSPEPKAEVQAFTLDSAYQGQEGAAMVKAAADAGTPYAVAFVDMRMPPGWDGLETIRRIWTADADCEIVICTAYSDHGWDEIRDALPQDERFLILKKPFDAVEAQQLASALTRKWSLARQAEMKLETLDSIVDERTKKLAEAHQKLQHNQQQLVQSEKMASIGQLAAGVAHEINNPIGFVKSNLGTLKDYVGIFVDLLQKYEQTTKGGPEAAGILREIESIKEEEDLSFVIDDTTSLLAESLDGIVRVQEIVQNLKSFARVDDDGATLANLNECIDSTLKIVWNELKYNCTIEKNYGDLPMTSCRAGQLNQVFMNLLVNASHAVGEQGTITITTSSSDGQILIEISDTGCGIPEEKLSRIFDPFFTTKPVGKGTGLGLSISHGIVEGHGGSIDVESKVGEGTRFTVRLPVADDS